MTESGRTAIAAETIKNLTDEDQKIRAKLVALRQNFRRRGNARIGLRYSLVFVAATTIAYLLGAGLGLAVFLGLLVLWVSEHSRAIKKIDGVLILIEPFPWAIHGELRFCASEAWEALTKHVASRDAHGEWMSLFDSHSFTVLSNGLVFSRGEPGARPTRGTRLFPDDFDQPPRSSIEAYDWLAYENPSSQTENGQAVHRGAGWSNDLELVLLERRASGDSLFRVPAESFRKAESVSHARHQVAVLAACGWERDPSRGSYTWRHRFASLSIESWDA